MELFKRYVTFIMAFFTLLNLVTLCQFYSNTSPVSFTKLHWETMEWVERRFFAYMAISAYHLISTEVENYIFKYNWIFRHLCIYSSPHCQKSRILIFLGKYYIVISDTLVDPFSDALFLLLSIIPSELHEKLTRKDWVAEKST